MMKKHWGRSRIVAGVAVALAMVVFIGSPKSALADECTDEAVAMIDALESTVNALVDHNGLRNGLIKKLGEARKVLADDNANNDHVALRKLGDFQDQVEGAVPRKLDAGDAQTLLDGADAVIAKLAECGVG